MTGRIQIPAATGHITLDRTNLLAMADSMDRSAPPVDSALQPGWGAAVDAIRMIAAEMPELYGDAGCLIVTPAPEEDRRR